MINHLEYSQKILIRALGCMFLPPIVASAIQEFVSPSNPYLSAIRVAVVLGMQTAIVLVAMFKISRHNRVRKQIFDERERFFGMVCHDLKSPLGTIHMALPMVREQCSGSVDNKIMDLIDRNVRTMTTLTDDLINLIVMNHHKIPINKTTVDLPVLLEDIKQAHSNKIDDKNIDFVAEAKLQNCLADERRLRQILNNLIANAIKFTPCGGRVAVRIYPRRHVALFEVEDSGPGIPKDKLDKIFQPYVQVSKSDAASGTGLGLSIVRSLVQAHGGDVWVDPHFDGGGRFCFKLPIGEATI